MRWRTCGDYWISSRAQRVSGSPRREEPPQSPEEKLDPRRDDLKMCRLQPADLSLPCLMEEKPLKMAVPPKQRQLRLQLLRYRGTSTWQPFIRFRSSPISTNSSLSQISLHLSYVSTRFPFEFSFLSEINASLINRSLPFLILRIEKN